MQNDSSKVYRAFTEKGDEPSLVVPFEAGKLVALAEMIARGLLYYHWELRVLPDLEVSGICANHEGDVILSENFFDGMTGDKLTASIGGGSLNYSVVKSTSQPWISIWRFSFYNGARMGDSKGQFSDCVWIIIGPKNLVKNFTHL
ncbi:MAG: hypothetical protein GQ535_14390 [Rhodobacteraceae bacterium]|nr:hypothetical protein [Paracoccaceae bacterium]